MDSISSLLLPKFGQSQKERFGLVFSNIFWFSEPRPFPARSPSFAPELRWPSGPEVPGCNKPLGCVLIPANLNPSTTWWKTLAPSHHPAPLKELMSTTELTTIWKKSKYISDEENREKSVAKKAHLRIKPPLMAICSRSSTTRAGWLATTPSWLLPQAFL